MGAVGELAVGSTFAGLRIEGVAGRGGMGVVYRAFDPELERAVAVKVVSPDLAADPEFQERFRRESRAAAAVHHPHVIPIHRAGREKGMLFLVMHYVVGDDLRELVGRAGRLDPLLAGTVVGQVAGALDAAHRRDLVHRDVKPANILVGAGHGPAQPHAYLTDFGLTRRIQPTEQLTATGVVLGTVDYMAPELFDAGPPSVASDVYALGCVLFHALTGAVPFVRADLGGLVGAHLVIPPPSLGAAVPDPGLRAALDAVIARAMAKAPADRYPSAGELGAAVDAALERLRAGRTNATGHPRHADTVGTAPPGGTPASGPPHGGPAPVGPVYAPPLDPEPARYTPPGGSRPSAPPADLPRYGPPDEPATGLPAPHLPQFIAPEELADPPRYNGGRDADTVAVSAPGQTGPVGPGLVGPDAVGSGSGPGRATIAILALLVVALVAVGVVLLRPLLSGGPEQPPAAPSAAEATIVLAAPVDDGTSVALSWAGPAGLDYGVDVAAEGAAAQTTYAGRVSSVTVPVRAGVRYCFQVRASNGQGVFASNVQPLRGATCAT
jgi:hypothetical protein